MPTNAPQLHQVRLNDPRVAPLLVGLAAEYAQRYGAVDVLADASADEFDPPAGAFLIAVLDGVTVAGGGLRRLDAQACEVKRMWSAPEHRRSGLARLVLSALEGLACERGYRLIRLETGPAQPEALAFYREAGYRTIPVYGRYEAATAFERALPATG